MTLPKRADCIKAIRKLLAAGAPVAGATAVCYFPIDCRKDSYGFTPLHRCSASNCDAAALTAAVETLVAAGADVRAKDSYGREPLHYAGDVSAEVSEAAVAAVKALVAAGADVRARDSHGVEPLHLAARIFDAETAAAAVQALLAAGADAQAKDNKGREPLHYVVVHSSWPYNDGSEVAALVQALLAGGADAQAKDNKGKTPLRLALRRVNDYSPRRAAAAAALLSADTTDTTTGARCFPALAPPHLRMGVCGIKALTHLHLVGTQGWKTCAALRPPTVPGGCSPISSLAEPP